MTMIPAVIVLTSNHDRADCRTGVVAAHRSCRRPCHRPTLFKVRYDTIRYDTRCYVNVRSKADISQLKAKFHYTGPIGPARTLSETRTDPTEFLGDPGRKKVCAGPVGPV